MIIGDPRRSMFRIHRDARFSKDKSSCKTNAGARLYHRDAGRKVGTVGEGGGAGFYFHIDPTTCFMAGASGCPPGPRFSASARRSRPSPPRWHGSRGQLGFGGASTA
jgi:uncharacterized protein (DUF2461 family)